MNFKKYFSPTCSTTQQLVTEVPKAMTDFSCQTPSCLKELQDAIAQSKEKEGTASNQDKKDSDDLKDAKNEKEAVSEKDAKALAKVAKAQSKALEKEAKAQAKAQEKALAKEEKERKKIEKAKLKEIRITPVIAEGIKICCITLNSADCIRLVAFPVDLRNVIRLAIHRGWGEIQQEREAYGSYEFKCRGNPWAGYQEQGVNSRKLLVAMLTTMAQYGWNLIQAADTSMKVHDKDSLYFEYTERDPGTHMFGISFNSGNKIRLIGPCQLEMRDVLKSAVSMWTEIRKEKMYFTAYQLKVVGYPWYSHEARTSLLLCQILANFRAHGYRLYGSVDISYGSTGGGGDEEGRDLESWVFRRDSPFW